jgi:site-specific recombinase XerC
VKAVELQGQQSRTGVRVSRAIHQGQWAVCKAFSYNYLERIGDDLIGLALTLGHDHIATTQIYTRKPLGALQDAIEKSQRF